ncbi:unannotated protein [freshwater metagenome]|uniref:Unannotated protein n=1 Tax=freshwater metagenome TaxID=449393 RepID=A0A6J6CV91_9ZZZZ|nr:hypothetical protein [Actinomycetota bacterium]
MTRTIATALEERLRSLGVQRVYGQPLASLQHVAVENPDLAVLLADADGRIGHHDGSGRLGAALLAGPILHLSSSPGGLAPLQRVTSAVELLDALVDPPGMLVPGTLALHLDLDLAEVIADDVGPTKQVERVPVLTLEKSLSALNIVILVGPGVIRANAVDGVRDFARTSSSGIVTSWGAKGVERWDSPFHFGTFGLQQGDALCTGLDQADLVILSGVDPAETPPHLTENFLTQEVPPSQLHALVAGWTASTQLPQRPAEYEQLRDVITPMYESDAVPLTPPRAALHLAGMLPERGIVVADPGAAGFWLARSFPTSFPENICVPASFTPGFAAAAALVCCLEGRPYFAVSDQIGGIEGIDDVTAELLELAEQLEQGVALQLWGPEGQLENSASHIDLLQSELDAEHVRIDEIPVNVDATEDLERVAGELIAWPIESPY